MGSGVVIGMNKVLGSGVGRILVFLLFWVSFWILVFLYVLSRDWS